MNCNIGRWYSLASLGLGEIWHHCLRVLNERGDERGRKRDGEKEKEGERKRDKAKEGEREREIRKNN